MLMLHDWRAFGAIYKKKTANKDVLSHATKLSVIILSGIVIGSIMHLLMLPCIAVPPATQ